MIVVFGCVDLCHVSRPVKYVPAWMPGAAWKRQGKAYRENMSRMSDIPFQFVKSQIVKCSRIQYATLY